MANKISKLREKMTPARQERNRQEAQKILKDMNMSRKLKMQVEITKLTTKSVKYCGMTGDDGTHVLVNMNSIAKYGEFDEDSIADVVKSHPGIKYVYVIESLTDPDKRGVGYFPNKFTVDE